MLPQVRYVLPLGMVGFRGHLQAPTAAARGPIALLPW